MSFFFALQVQRAYSCLNRSNSPGTPRPFSAALRRQPNSTEKSVIAAASRPEQRPFKTPQLPALRAVVREPAPQKRRFFLLLLLSSLGKRPGGRKQAVSALAEQRPKTGPKPPGGAGMLSLPAGGHTAAHTAKQGDNGREKKCFFFVLRIRN